MLCAQWFSAVRETVVGTAALCSDANESEWYDYQWNTEKKIPILMMLMFLLPFFCWGGGFFLAWGCFGFLFVAALKLSWSGVGGECSRLAKEAGQSAPPQRSEMKNPKPGTRHNLFWCFGGGWVARSLFVPAPLKFRGRALIKGFWEAFGQTSFDSPPHQKDRRMRNKIGRLEDSD